MNKELIELLNYRIQQEQYSSRIYEQIGLWLENKAYENAAKLYKKYAHEELEHAEWAKEHLLNHNVEPEIRTLPAPDLEYSTLKEILDLTLEHEQDITNQCNELAKKAQDIGYYPTFELGLKYCKEQAEELGKAYDLIDIYEKCQGNELIFDHYIENKV